MRSNFRLMRAMSDHTRLSPADRINRLMAFNQRLHATPESCTALTEWNMQLDRRLVEFPGRALPQEEIIFGNGKKY